MWSLAAVLGLLVLPAAQAGCAIYQNGTMKMPLGFSSPGPLLKYDLEGGDNPCPAFAQGDDVCCSTTQLKALRINFALLDVTFGAPSNGGCPACFANLAHAWCQQTCSPHQDQIISNPVVTKKQGIIFEHTVLEYDLSMNTDFACQAHQSCSKTTTVVQSGFTTEGLWNFQGHSPGVITTQQVFINMQYDDLPVPRAIGGPIQLCDSYERALAYGANASAVGNASCPASTCSSTYTPPSVAGLTDPLYTTWSGFQWLPVVIFYSVLLVCSALISAYGSCSERHPRAAHGGSAASSGQEPLLSGDDGLLSEQHSVQQHKSINDEPM